ncbi:MAG: hypothetical protein HWE26_17565 [Alteromonadaceae bacterium]|nr:hypothetical protein [Alteromonadaceae bacterium]
MSVTQVSSTTVPSNTITPGSSQTASASAPNDPASNTDMWRFGASTTRFDTDGTVRWATAEELNSAVRTTPAAMLSVLNTGADLLRFEANGVYKNDAAAIAALYDNTALSPDEIAAQVAQATAELREKIRNDIANGVFRVNNGGQVVHTRDGVETTLEPEEVGFELNSALIRSQEEEILRLNNLNSRLNQMDQFIASQLDQGEQELTLLYERELFREREEEIRGAAGVNIKDPWHNADNDGNPARSKFGTFDYNEWRSMGSHKTELDKFVGDTFSEYDGAAGDGQRFFNELRAEYESLLKFSELEIEGWDTNGGTSGVSHGSWEGPKEFFQDSTIFGDRYFERVRNNIRNVNQRNVQENTFEIASQKIETRIRTVGSLAEQMGTDFKTDNARFNNILEAMNNYNKLVADSLQRFSVI